MDVVAQGLQHLAVPAKGDDDIGFLRVDRVIAPLSSLSALCASALSAAMKAIRVMGRAIRFALPGAGGNGPGLPAGRRRV